MTEYRPENPAPQPAQPTQYLQPAGHDATDQLTMSPVPKRKGKALLAGGVGLASLALVAGGVLYLDPFDLRAADDLADGPAKVLPADSEFFASVDFDPSVGQKVELVRFAMKFPALKSKVSLTEEGDLKKQLFEAATKNGGCEGASYEADIAPWVGDQFALAQRKGDADLVMAIEAKDEQKAREGIKKFLECGGSTNKTMGMAYIDGYLIAADDQAAADKVVADAKASPLSTKAEFTEDFAKLGKTGIVSMWASGDFKNTVQPPTDVPIDEGTLREAQTMRSAAATLRFTDGNPELHLVAKSKVPMVDSDARTAIGELPADSLLAFGLAGGKQNVQQAWPEIAKALEAQGAEVADLESRLGMKLSEALQTAVGDDLRLAVGKFDPEALNSEGPSSLPAGVALTTDQGKLAQLLEAAKADEQGVVVEYGEKTHGVAFSQEWATKMTKADGEKLSSNEKFSQAVPNAERAQAAGFVDLETLIGIMGDEMPAEQRQNLEPLKAVGMSATTEGDDYGAATVRVVAK